MHTIIQRKNGAVDLMVTDPAEIVGREKSKALAKLSVLVAPDRDPPATEDEIKQVDIDYQAAITPEAILAGEIDKWKQAVELEGNVQHSAAEEYMAHTSVDPSTLPKDMTFFRAWAFDGSKVTVNMTKARELHRSTLRAMRSPLFAALDVEYQRADESGDDAKKTAIAKRKQALRDITKHPDIEAATTTDQLKQAGISALGVKS